MNPTPDPFAQAQLGPVTLRNRILKAATFEGMTSEHVVSDELIEFHRRFAAGGVGLTTVAYCAVSPEGCGAPNEMILGERAVPGLQRLADAVHAEGAAVSAQIGHAGAVYVVSHHFTPDATVSDLAGPFDVLAPRGHGAVGPFRTKENLAVGEAIVGGDEFAL